MPIPDDIRTEAEAHLDRYISNLIPKHVQDKLRIGYVAKGMAITLFEQRPYWKDKAIWTKSDVARARYSKTDGEWTLYWRDRNEKWHVYLLATAEISTRASLGNRATWTVTRAGGLSLKNVP